MDDNLKRKLANYRTPERVIELIRATNIVFLVGVSAAGKDTVINQLDKNSSGYHLIVSHTTRPPRHNHGVLEQNGVEYHFIDLRTAETMLDEGGFVEAKLVHGNVYGTSVAEIQMAHDEGKIAITEIEVQGIAEYKRVADNVLPIFLLPPDFKTWQGRFHKRYDADKINRDDMKKRMETARDELVEALSRDYYQYVVNKDLNETVRIVGEIAHGNLSTEKNQQAKVVARQLLDQLATLL